MMESVHFTELVGSNASVDVVDDIDVGTSTAELDEDAAELPPFTGEEEVGPGLEVVDSRLGDTIVDDISKDGDSWLVDVTDVSLLVSDPSRFNVTESVGGAREKE